MATSGADMLNLFSAILRGVRMWTAKDECLGSACNAQNSLQALDCFF